MADTAFEDVQVLFVDPDRGSRESIRNMLTNGGFRSLRGGSSFRDLIDGTQPPGPDLVVCEIDVEDGDVCKWIYDMRHQRVGPDPFLPFIATTWTPTPDLVRRVIDAGADDLLSKPLSSERLIGRIRNLVRGRKPFVVTSDYVGPDRHRADERPNTAELVEVPNRLRERTLGAGDPRRLARQINDALSRINRHKMDSQGARIVQLAERLAPLLDAGLNDDIVYRQLRHLYETVEDLGRRVVGTDCDHAADLCRSLLDVVEAIRRGINDPSRTDIRLLKPLAEAIRASFSGSQSAALAARQIHATVSGAHAFFDADTTRRLDEATERKPGAERRQKFLLRLLVGKISHLLSDHLGRRQIIPRAFLNGFDEYLTMLLGEQLYADLNPQAADLLARIQSDDDFLIWRTILANEEYRAFSYSILAQILLKFRPFGRGKRNFMAIVNTVIAETLKPAGKYDGRDAFTEGHFNLVFATLFSDIFDAVESAENAEAIDELLGKDTTAALRETLSEYRAYIHLQDAREAV